MLLGVFGGGKEGTGIYTEVRGAATVCTYAPALGAFNAHAAAHHRAFLVDGIKNKYRLPTWNLTTRP